MSFTPKFDESSQRDSKFFAGVIVGKKERQLCFMAERAICLKRCGFKARSLRIVLFVKRGIMLITPISVAFSITHSKRLFLCMARATLGCAVEWMQFGGGALSPLPGQLRAAFNARSMWAFDLADAIGLGLVAFCRDPKAHEDLIALGSPEAVERAAYRQTAGAKVEVMMVKKTEEIKKTLGRSPDHGMSILCASARPAGGGEWE